MFGNNLDCVKTEKEKYLLISLKKKKKFLIESDLQVGSQNVCS